MLLSAIRSMKACLLAASLAVASSALLASTALAADRLALVIGEANYVGDPLPTAAADAALVAKTLGAQGFDVTELHELNAADLAAGYQAFLAKVRSAPTASITVYLAGLGANVGCDDYLLPIDAQIAAETDVPKVGLSLTQVMGDLAQTPSQVRVVLLDGARPIPPSVSAAPLPQGLIPLAPAPATSFGLAAEIHDYEAPPKAGDANDAFANGLTGALQQPYADVDTMLRATRLAVHQATAGGQTPWHASAAATPPFVFLPGATATQIQAAAAGLPITPAALSSLPADVAYWSAIWRNTAADYQASLDAFGATAPQDQAERVRMLLALLNEPNPSCAAPPPLQPVTVIGGVYCPEGYAGYCAPPVGCSGWGCLPPPPPPCVPWHWGCGLPPPPSCFPWHPGCPPPPPPHCLPWHPGCPLPPVCIPWHPGCPIPPVCVPWHPGCPVQPSCVPWHPGCPIVKPVCIPWHPGCPGGPPPSCVPWHPGCPIVKPVCIPWHPGCPGGPPPSCAPWHPGCPGGPVFKPVLPLQPVHPHPIGPVGPKPHCIPGHPGCP